MANEKILELSSADFKETISGDKPVLVDFWAPWCGPCRMVAPVLEQIADENADVQIAKLNVDDNQELAMQYQVSSIPSFILFKNGEAVDRMMGAMPKSAFEQFIARNTAAAAASNA